MRLAVIDLGTNSIRFDIHEISANRQGTLFHRRLYRERAMVRLGQNLFIKGELSPESKRRTLDAVESFRTTMDALRVDRTVAFGTAAMRDASDGESFLEEIKAKTGVEFRIISGSEEASLIAKGILSNSSSLPHGLMALIDIGGGSTEISICKGTKILHAHSFDLGVAKLQQVFLKTQPPIRRSKKVPDPVTELRNYIKSVVLPVLLVKQWPATPAIVGSSGSALALAKLVHKEKAGFTGAFPKKTLQKLLAQMRTKTTGELLSMRGMEPKRVDIILAGAILLDELAELLKAKTIRTTEFALRDGILVDELEHYSRQKQKKSSFELKELEKRIQQWGMDEKHNVSVRENAEWLFDHLKAVHLLKQEWRIYLSAAAILHDVGEIISPAHHAEHSEYIVKNANFVGMRPWEANFIASLCRFHQDEKLLDKKNEKKIPYPKKDELRLVFLKLLALLQLSDAMDRSHKNAVKLTAIKIQRTKLELRFKSKTTCDLELLRFEQKKALFQQVFGREATLVRAR